MGGGRAGVLDAAVISLIIKMMYHMSCWQALMVCTAHLCQAVLGGSVGTHTLKTTGKMATIFTHLLCV